MESLPVRLFALFYAFSTYAIFHCIFALLINWKAELSLPIFPSTIRFHSIEHGPLIHICQKTLTPILSNALLMLTFALTHSIMARPQFKRFIYGLKKSAEGESNVWERNTFTLVTSLQILLLILAWQPMKAPATIAHVFPLWVPTGNHISIIAPTVISLLGVALVLYCTFCIDHWEMVGISQALSFYAGRSTHKSTATYYSSFPYSLVQHPMMTGMLIFIWSVPRMTFNHFFFASVLTAYIMVGTVCLEEAEMAKRFGDEYLERKQKMGRFFPRWSTLCEICGLCKASESRPTRRSAAGDKKETMSSSKSKSKLSMSRSRSSTMTSTPKKKGKMHSSSSASKSTSRSASPARSVPETPIKKSSAISTPKKMFTKKSASTPRKSTFSRSSSPSSRHSTSSPTPTKKSSTGSVSLARRALTSQSARKSSHTSK